MSGICEENTPAPPVASLAVIVGDYRRYANRLAILHGGRRTTYAEFVSSSIGSQGRSCFLASCRAIRT